MPTSKPHVCAARHWSVLSFFKYNSEHLMPATKDSCHTGAGHVVGNVQEINPLTTDSKRQRNSYGCPQCSALIFQDDCCYKIYSLHFQSKVHLQLENEELRICTSGGHLNDLNLTKQSLFIPGFTQNSIQIYCMSYLSYLLCRFNMHHVLEVRIYYK